MATSAFFAFLHHVAAFAFVAALAVEFVLVRGELNLGRAKGLLIADAVAGAAAGVVLVVGLLRVFYFEKGAAYYFHNAAFLGKMGLFVLIALASIYPTVTFLSWRKSLKAGKVPVVDPRRIRTVRMLFHWEFAGIVLLILCAALMARGIG